MKTKATISLENRKKLEGIKTASWVEVSLSFLCNFDVPINLSLFFTQYF
jgi:hypothetical protein